MRSPQQKNPEEIQEGGVIDCRPVGIGNALRCLITKALFKQVTQVFNKAYSPMQYGRGEKAGGTKMYFNIKAHMEANSTHAVLSLDYSNAFNEASREKILEALWTVPDLRPIWFFCYHVKATSVSVLGTHSLQPHFDPKKEHNKELLKR